MKSLKEKLIDLADEHFPKGKSKERGQAMVLVALSLQAFSAELERIEATLPKEIQDHFYPHEPEYARNEAIKECRAIIQQARKELA